MRLGLHLRAGRIGSRGSACRLQVGHVRVWLAPHKRGAGATLHTMCLHEAVSQFLVLCLGSGLALHHAPKNRVGLLVHGRNIKSVAMCVWVLGGLQRGPGLLVLGIRAMNPVGRGLLARVQAGYAGRQKFVCA